LGEIQEQASYPDIFRHTLSAHLAGRVCSTRHGSLGVNFIACPMKNDYFPWHHQTQDDFRPLPGNS